jgi:hypothetical protein
VALSKHQSSAEGRIAPETLVGYATPALATLQLEPSPVGFGRAPAATHQPTMIGATPPIAVGTDARSEHDASGSFSPPPRRRVPALALGVGLGLVAVAVLAVGMSLIAGSAKKRDPAVSPRPSVGTSPRAREPSEAILPAVPASSERAPAEPIAVSSVAAEAAPAPLEPRAKPASAKKPGAITPSRARPPASPPPAPTKASSSDLGF